jgi:hypothetical protein
MIKIGASMIRDRVQQRANKKKYASGKHNKFDIKNPTADKAIKRLQYEQQLSTLNLLELSQSLRQWDLDNL